MNSYKLVTCPWGKDPRLYIVFNWSCNPACNPSGGLIVEEGMFQRGNISRLWPPEKPVSYQVSLVQVTVTNTCSGESHQPQPRTPSEDARWAPLRQPLVQPDRELSDQGLSSSKDPSEAHLTNLSAVVHLTKQSASICPYKWRLSLVQFFFFNSCSSSQLDQSNVLLQC